MSYFSFIQVEAAFFWMWWQKQTPAKKRSVKNLVKEGRLEFAGGGWSMNDEAAAHYTGIIDNMSGGFAEFKRHFGRCGAPRVGWQIDPFGHSREQAALFAMMGFNAWFFPRIDDKEKAKRKKEGFMQVK